MLSCKWGLINSFLSNSFIHSLSLLGQKEQDLLQVPESLISTSENNGILFFIKLQAVLNNI